MRVFNLDYPSRLPSSLPSSPLAPLHLFYIHISHRDSVVAIEAAPLPAAPRGRNFPRWELPEGIMLFYFWLIATRGRRHYSRMNIQRRSRGRKSSALRKLPLRSRDYVRCLPAPPLLFRAASRVCEEHVSCAMGPDGINNVHVCYFHQHCSIEMFLSFFLSP